ncbi:hypothetical protein TNCV_1246671 [Trichonephila clavipes]|uniref:Uncharacterized protein n=1 Tax=Trichonephila clavipes TaxID=2585209 RepID=A0A8X6REU5_TRICX|nr:hypothetical protein TNCV_1246671 [Trichonephila clavipes]
MLCFWKCRSGGHNPRHSVPKARNIPLDKSDHHCPEAVTGLRRYRYNTSAPSAFGEKCIVTAGIAMITSSSPP